MEITLEKIELVKDRTGVSYKEAKEALEAAEGNVVDAIIAIEETVNIKPDSKATEFAQDTVAKVKELVKKGNITKLSVKRDDEVLLNIPLNIGLVGAVVAPWGAVASLVAAFGFKCKIELTKEDGSVIDVSSKAEDVFEVAKEKGSEYYEVAKEKGSEYYEKAKEKAPDYYEKAKDVAGDVFDKAKDVAGDVFVTAKDKAGDAFEAVKDKAEDIVGSIKGDDDIEIEFEFADEAANLEEEIEKEEE